MTDQLHEQIAAIPFEDHHVHPPFARAHAISSDDFRRPFTEASIAETWTAHLGTQIGYRWMVRELAGLLGVAPDEAAVLAARNGTDAAAYHRLLADDANLGACYADDLFAFGQCIPTDAWAAMLGRPVWRVLRVETFVEQGYAACPMLDDALHRLTTEIAAAGERGIVALKSIAGYRCGLFFDAPSSGQRHLARDAYARLRDAALGGGSGRIAARALVDTIVWTALEAAIPQRLPMQFHVALGDDDIVMQQNDPTLMRALFVHEPFRVVPLVLLHNYPYHRQAGYLASLYPNVYVDLGLTIPIVGPQSAVVLAETLECAPVSQVLASTDGHMEPEFQWWGVRLWRLALGDLFGRYVAQGIFDDAGAHAAAAMILRDTARRIYPQPGH